MIPTTIHGLIETRTRLTAMLRTFRSRGPRGLFAFGRHSRPEAVILPWPLFERLSDAAHALEDAARAAELDRRRRNPTGPGPVTLDRLAELLDCPVPPPSGAGPGAGPGGSRALVVWPTALDDLLRLAEEHPRSARSAIAHALVDLAHGRLTGAVLGTLPGQPRLDAYRRTVVPLADPARTDTAGAVTVVFGGAGEHPLAPAVELLAVLTAGPLVSALHELDPALELDPPTADGG